MNGFNLRMDASGRQGLVLFLAFNLRPRDIFLIMFGRVDTDERLVPFSGTDAV
jgi:hypothetical protein